MTVRALIDELNRLTKLYDEGNPEVSDKEWDDLYFELVEIFTIIKAIIAANDESKTIF